MIHKFDYVFAENGTVQYKDGKLFSKHVSERQRHINEFMYFPDPTTPSCRRDVETEQ